jgi:YbbR domain-containing protein
MKPRTLGKPLAGRAELDYDPKTVTIRGPARRLTEQQTVLTEPVDVDGRVESFVKRVRVISPSENWLTAIQPAEITVRVSIVAELASREFSDVPVLAVLPPGAVPSVRTTPERVRVTLRGRREELDSLAPEAVRVFVDLCGVETEGSYELPVNVHLPRGGDVSAGADPPTVRVAFGVK